MKRTILYTLFFTFFIGSANGQTLKAFLEAAEEAIVDKDYYNAAYFYRNAAEFDTTDLDIQFKLAQVSQKFNAFSLAEKSYQYVVDNDSVQAFPMAPFHLAEIQQRLGSYDDAERNFSMFISENNASENKNVAKAEQEIKAIKWAKKKTENPIDGVKVDKMDNGMNTPYSEYSAIRIDSQLYYSSHRFEVDEDNKVDRLFSKVLTAEGDSTNTLLDNSFNDSGPHVGNITFNNKRNSVFYTVCEYVNSYDIVCDIYKRNIDENGKWSDGIKLPISINDTSSTNTQPAVGYDFEKDKEILYFVSDRKGGKGGMDIWYTTIEDGVYSEPENLSEINTAADELTPFFHAQTSTLYFSTNGRLGMGGQDIFSSQKFEVGFGDPVNLGVPQNTSYDDIYYSLNPDGTEALFSSNRKGSLYLDDSYEACCFDVYRAEIEELLVDLKILTFDDLTKDPIPGTRVRIIDPVTGDVLFDSLDPLSNTHTFKLRCNRDYTILTEKDGYEPNETKLNTSDCGKLEQIIKEIYLEPKKLILDVFTFEELSKAPLEGTTITLRDLTRIGDPDYEPVVVTDPKGNNHNFEIIAGGNYELVAEKDGYQTVIQKVNTNMVIDGVVTEKLYLFKGPIKLNVYTFETISKLPLDGTTITLRDLSKSGNPNYVPLVVKDPNGNFHSFEIIPTGNYELVAEKRGYQTVTQKVNTDLIIDGVVTQKLYLYKGLIKLDVYTFEKLTQAPLNGTTITLIDLSKYGNANYKPQVVRDINGNYHRFDIIAGGDYELVAEKSGYQTVTQKVNSSLIVDGVVTEKLYLFKGQIKLDVFTFDQLSLDPLDGTTITLIDLSKYGNANYKPQVVRDIDGNYQRFDINPGGIYELWAEKSGYQLVSQKVNTSLVIDGVITEKLYLYKGPIKLDVFTFDKLSLDPLNGTTITLRDLSKSGDANYEPRVVRERNGNYHRFNILPGGLYELEAKKLGYNTVTQRVNTRKIIDGIVTEKLYLIRELAKLDEYLPVVVYFDNDRPNRRSTKMYTDLSYSDTYGDYYKKKEEFKNSYTDKLRGRKITEGKADLESFFENDVKSGYDKLQLFISKVKDRLDSGDIIELSLKGFASPRAASKYNLALGQRRIWTLKNELSTYGGGALSSYIKSGQLRIAEVSFGEEIAPAGISDAYKNPRLSVYSVEASRERKAEVIRVKILN